MIDINANAVISMPSQLFTLANSFEAAANGKIYIGKINTDPTIPTNQIQVYLQNEDGSTVPVAQPIIINAGGYPVYNGQIAKFVTVEGHSMAVYDAYNVQQFYFPNVLKYDSDMLRQALAQPDGVSLVNNAVDQRDLAGAEKGAVPVDHVHIINGPIVDFRRFLTVKDGSVDATQAVIDALNSGLNVQVSGDYILRLDSAGITADVTSRFFGAPGTSPSILMNHTDVAQPQFLFKQSRNYISNFKFRYPNQRKSLATGMSPLAYPALLTGNAFASVFTNLDIGNAYRGLQFGDATYSSSRVTISNIIGAPLRRGISLERVLDIPHVSDILFNYNYLSADERYDISLKQWIHDNLDGFHLGRCDFGAFSRIFVFGAYNGIFLRSERYTGSANSVRFTDCDVDITVHPLRFQNWQNQLTVTNGKFTGNAKSTGGLVEKERSTNLFQGTGEDGVIVLNSTEMNNYSSDVIQTSANIKVIGAQFYEYGLDNAQRAAIATTTSTNPNITILGTKIDGASGTQTRGVYGTTSTGTLTLGDGTNISGATLESFNWAFGPVRAGNGVTISGAPAKNSTSFISNIPHIYPVESMPTRGNYFKPGDYAQMTKPVKTNFASVPNYVVKGWVRLTSANSSGTNHVLNTDWVEDRTYFAGA
ncbi:phage head-binding domain-containing protein [Chania multitudinisentens]|uniref:phage head-binding domain-containing protein n=1 Tax=Chania multitudinisentens TaxID=1639108 RepID=UPI0003E14BE1|nr:phage head-binding domain-containing protein [Chania multitudinisentens]